MTSEEIPHLVRGKTPRLQAKPSLYCWKWQSVQWNISHQECHIPLVYIYSSIGEFFIAKTGINREISFFRLLDKLKIYRANCWKLVVDTISAYKSSHRITYKNQLIDNFSFVCYFKVSKTLSDPFSDFVPKVLLGYRSRRLRELQALQFQNSSIKKYGSFKVFQVSPFQKYPGLVLWGKDRNQPASQQLHQRNKLPQEKLLSVISNPLQLVAIPVPNSSLHPLQVSNKKNQDCTFFTLVTNPMGCILPKRQKHLGLEGDIKISELDARIDPQPTTLIENSPTVLKYQTPHFRATAKVRFPPISGSDVWQIGWVQGCSNMDFNITYGGLGVSSWEIPPLRSKQQKFVSDSDGKHYPWYGCTTEVATITGPTSCYTTCHLRMNDNFHPSITWDIPVRNSHEVKLTHLGRDQSFTVWLVAINKSTGQKFVLRTVKWRMRINIAVDPSQALGRRARLLDPVIQDQPTILEPSQNEIPPPEALKAPNANNAQTLIWRPTNGREVVIVPPVSQ